MVSIIPGIDARAPERTLTSSGADGSPRRAPMAFSSRVTAAVIACSTAWAIAPDRANAMQTSVAIVNPGGTGSPIAVISARPAPFPPRRSRRFGSPSALPSPKKYTLSAMVAISWGGRRQ
jgi:hypothetical protein